MQSCKLPRKINKKW